LLDAFVEPEFVMPGQLELIGLSETQVAESEKGLDLFDFAKVSAVAAAVDL